MFTRFGVCYGFVIIRTNNNNKINVIQHKMVSFIHDLRKDYYGTKSYQNNLELNSSTCKVMILLVKVFGISMHC